MKQFLQIGLRKERSTYIQYIHIGTYSLLKMYFKFIGHVEQYLPIPLLMRYKTIEIWQYQHRGATTKTLGVAECLDDTVWKNKHIVIKVQSRIDKTVIRSKRPDQTQQKEKGSWKQAR